MGAGWVQCAKRAPAILDTELLKLNATAQLLTALLVQNLRCDVVMHELERRTLARLEYSNFIIVGIIDYHLDLGDLGCFLLDNNSAVGNVLTVVLPVQLLTTHVIRLTLKCPTDI